MSAPREGRSLAWLRGFWRSLRPGFWVVTIFPLYMGWVLATRELAPALDVWVALAAEASAQGVTPGRLAAATASWAAEAWPLLAGVACLGPLIWGSTLLYNNYRDLAADRVNPRRQRDPLVLGQVRPRQALWGARLLGAAGLGVAALIGPFFLAAMAACLLLSWAYSSPPLHLKARAGFDVLVNVVGIGVLCTLAGWSIGAPLRGFPWPFMVLPVLHLASTYIPTTLVDYPTDKAFGLDTIAVRLGPGRTFWLGFATALAANLVFLLAAWREYVITWEVYRVIWPASVAELIAYLGLRHWQDLRRFFLAMVLAVLSFGTGTVVFLLAYTGWLVL